MNLKAPKIIDVAKAKLIINYPFFGTLAVYLVPMSAPDKTKTIATDGETLYYNPLWIEKIAENEGLDAVVATLAHMVLHCGLGHLWRRNNRSTIKWNISTDAVVNEIINDSNFKLPKGSIDIKMFKGFGVNKNMAAEEVYAALPDVPEIISFIEGKSNANDDHNLWGKKSHMEESETQNIIETWKERMASALQSVQQRGDIPDSLKKIVDESLQPTINWRAILAEWLQPSRCEYTYLPSDRRFIHDEAYIPDFVGEELQDIVIAIDTSGSTFYYENIVDKFVAECKAILSVGKWSRLHIVYCDTEINKWDEIDQPEDFPGFDVCGGGGTSFIPVFEEIEKRGINPVALVYMTDGFGKFPSRAPEYPVLWAISTPGINPEDVPFGLTVKLKDDD
jgi:predicted metal-dependent peptidase